MSLAGVCLGLSLMAHPGSTFSLPIFGALLLRFRQLFALRRAALALLIVIAFYLPWSAYQKWVDPPGNRLLKMLNVVFLGGEKVLDSYGLTNVESWHIDHAATEESRIAQRHFMWNAVGLANAWDGWRGCFYSPNAHAKVWRFRIPAG